MVNQKYLIILTVYYLIMGVLSVYGIHLFVSLLRYYRNYKNIENPIPERLIKYFPTVTVQLPIYNEKYVIGRLLKYVCEIEYPKELLEIQVLDDSTDDSTKQVKGIVEKYKRQGYRISHIQRNNRKGYKAGALTFGLEKCSSEFIMIFDADFLPPKDILSKMLPYFEDEKVGMVQARWGHINEGYSLLTKIQAIFLNGHFVIEQTSRNYSGLFLNFNGTAGMWRKRTITDAGGWSSDTLAEDLDLSYRAQIKGWKFIFLPNTVVPAELPVEINSFKVQQHRWIKGSMQTAKKLLPHILKTKLPLNVKVEALFHLISNVNYLLLLLISILIFPVILIKFRYPHITNNYIDLAMALPAVISVIAFYVATEKETYSNWFKRLRYIPFFLSIGVGMAVNNSFAIIEAVFNKKSGFTRTPKYNIENRKDVWMNKIYREKANIIPFIEILLAVYFSYVLYKAIDLKMWGYIPAIAVFIFGFGYTGFLSLWHAFRKT